MGGKNTNSVLCVLHCAGINTGGRCCFWICVEYANIGSSSILDRRSFRVCIRNRKSIDYFKNVRLYRMRPIKSSLPDETLPTFNELNTENKICEMVSS